MSDFIKQLPKTVSKRLTPEMLDLIDKSFDDPQSCEMLRDNFVTLASLLETSRYKIEDFISALKFVQLISSGYKDSEAYSATFPDRYAKLVNEGRDRKEISSYVSAYKKGNLVTKIIERTMIPDHVLFRDTRQEAIMIQIGIAKDELVNPRDRVAAANSLIVALAPPKENKLAIDMNVKEQNAVFVQIQSNIDSLVTSTKKMVEQGITLKDAINIPLLTKEESHAD